MLFQPTLLSKYILFILLPPIVLDEKYEVCNCKTDNTDINSKNKKETDTIIIIFPHMPPFERLTVVTNSCDTRSCRALKLVNPPNK